MPFEYRLPILTLFFVKFVFPFRCWFFTGLTDMTALVAARAVAALDVVIQLALCFGRDLVAVDSGF